MEIRQAPYAAPDRAEWERQHGVKPFEIDTEPQFEKEAMDWIAEDLATLDAAKAESIADALESLSETIGIIEGITPDFVIFFDRTARKFVAYPSPL